MTVRAVVGVTVTVRSPFLFRGLGGNLAGVDAIQLRDEDGRPVLPGTQLLGVLRPALAELAAAAPNIARASDETELFGPRTGSPKFEVVGEHDRPIRGNALVGDLTADMRDASTQTTHIEIDDSPKFARRTEENFAAEADKLRPTVFAALLSGVASALRRRDQVPPVQLPRMADFATFVWRACPGLGWDPAAFLTAYEKNQALAAEIAFEADGVAAAVVALMGLRKPDDDGVTRWEGISTKLLDELPVDEKGRKAKWWPPENQVRNRLRALRTTLEAHGIILNLDIPGHHKGRLIKISQEPNATERRE